MLARLLGGSAITAIGVGMMRRGSQMRARARTAPLRAATTRRAGIISKVRTKTRGIAGESNPKLFSKTTLVGQKRRAMAAQSIKARRAGLPAGQTRASVASAVSAANRARTKTIVGNVKRTTYAIMPKMNLSKKTPAGRFTRYQTAQFMKTARKGPAQWGNTGGTYHLRKPRTHQGA